MSPLVAEVSICEEDESFPKGFWPGIPVRLDVEPLPPLPPILEGSVPLEGSPIWALTPERPRKSNIRRKPTLIGAGCKHLMLLFMECIQSVFLQETLHVHGCRCASPCSHDSLAVVGVAHVPGCKDTGHIGGATGALNLDITLLVEFQLAT